MSDSLTYFAYGSNLDLEQMRTRCPQSEALRPALLKGYRLRFQGYSARWDGGVATVTEDQSGEVPGLLYSMSQEDVQLLDGFEGFPKVYVRIGVEVQDETGVCQQVMTYQRFSETSSKAPSLLYFFQIWRGYKALGLPEQGLMSAVEECMNGNGHPLQGSPLEG